MIKTQWTSSSDLNQLSSHGVKSEQEDEAEEWDEAYFLLTHHKVAQHTSIISGAIRFCISSAEGSSRHHYVIQDKRTEGIEWATKGAILIKAADLLT